MTVFLIALMCISVVGISSVLYVKHWEASHGKLIMSGVRTKAGEALGVGLNFLEKRAPVVLRAAAMRGYIMARTLLHRGIAWMVLFVEHLLEKTLHSLRHTTQQRSDGEASEFLREVAEHKKQLQNSASKEQNAIYEE